MEGSEAPEPVAVCDIAGPHSRIVDTTATAEDATKLDDNLMTISPEGGRAAPMSMHVTAHSRNFRTWLLKVEKISDDNRRRHDGQGERGLLADFGYVCCGRHDIPNRPWGRNRW